MTWDWNIAREAFPDLLKAFLQVTLVVTVAASILSAILGLVWAIALRELPRPLSRLLGWLLGVIRMTPLPLQLLIVTFGIVTPRGWLAHLDGPDQLRHRLIIIGIAVFTVHYSTYMAESYRAGIESLPKGQWEAATALSLPPKRTWRAVIVPQALRATLPSLGNWAIAMFKDTPYLLAISVAEMVSEARRIGGENFSYTEAFTIAGLIFLVASYPTAILMRRLEKKLVY
ncbi:MAG TPA: amino acid ABC transporter permease [Flexivirga sp.]|uniref:amino acid ABC transporter permease n=1 Tax=Flexivirga sp. TaxID=1962927 RepID=UPI002BCAF90D|nr:amino acid ABC transporter permease [Flexivirga sp.]HWC23494.1 amino acid ABC transporter permease [Flexivirga sp.]